MGILTTLFAAGAVGGALASLPKTDGSVSPGISPVDLDYNLIPMLVKKEDGKLIFSDCPEYADNYGILYEGTVEKGKGRVYYYHVNETGKPARVLVYAKSDKKQDITVTRTVKGDPSADYMPTGATLSFREAVNEAGDPVLVKLLPKERTVLFEDDKKGIRSGDLVSGIVEIETKKPVSLGVAIVPDGTKEDVKKALDLSVPLLPDSHEMRGTFPMDVYMENKPWDFSKGNAAISIGNRCHSRWDAMSSAKSTAKIRATTALRTIWYSIPGEPGATSSTSMHRAVSTLAPSRSAIIRTFPAYTGQTGRDPSACSETGQKEITLKQAPGIWDAIFLSASSRQELLFSPSAS